MGAERLGGAGRVRPPRTERVRGETKNAGGPRAGEGRRTRMAMSRVERKADQDSRSMKGTLPATGGTLALAVAVTLLVGIVGGTTAGYCLGLSLNPRGGRGGTRGGAGARGRTPRRPHRHGRGGVIEGL